MQNLHVLKHVCTCIVYARLQQSAACRKTPFCTLAVFAKWQTALISAYAWNSLQKWYTPRQYIHDVILHGLRIPLRAVYNILLIFARFVLR